MHQKKICISLHGLPLEGAAAPKAAAIEALAQEEIYLLASGMPIVRCVLPSEERLCVQCIAESSSDILNDTPDLISPWLPQGVTLSTFSLQRIIFSIDVLQNRSFIFIDIEAYFEGHESFCILKGQLSLLQQQINLTLRLPNLCQQMITALGAPPHISIKNFRQELLHWLTRHPPQNPSAVLSELQRILLASDGEFKKIRTPSHLLKLVRSHLYLKGKHFPSTDSSTSKKQLFYRIFRSILHFPFGTKNVMCLVISLRSLSTYERFDDRHIMLACQRCLPSLEAVPRSFYVYSYPEESTLSLYIEVEKKDGSLPTLAEMKILKREICPELISSIEQIMSRIDIPHNEEDLLRNLLLLSQQVRTSKDLPQVIVHFHGQTDTSLVFHVTLVRCTKKDSDTIPLPTSDSSKISRCVLLRSSIVDRVRQKFVKQGVMFLIECSKERFLRRDRSVDFLRARESVVHCIESAYGKVRDLNGGLIYQQHQLLASIRPLLTKEEDKDISLIEDIFHSLSPTPMKNILGPEHIVTIFRQLISLRANLRQKMVRPFLIEEYDKEIFIGFFCHETFVKEDLFQAIPQFHLEDSEFALCHLTIEGHWLCCVICLCQDTAVRQHIILWLQEKLNKKVEVQTSRSFRMSLPRPTLLLDPRIGADRTSGAVIKMLYEGLMRLDKNENPSLAAAEDVFISDDGKTYTFKLRQSFWSNGQPVTAHDFEYAWKKILDPSFHSYFDFHLYPILNARLVKAGHLSADELGVHAANDHVLVVDLEHPLPHFLELCTLWMFSPLRKDIDTIYPGWAYYGDKNYVCNGPFTLKRVTRTGDIHLEKNTRYWDKDKVSIKKIDISIIENPLKALHLFSQGELDLIGDPMSEVPLRGINDSVIHSRNMSAVQCYMLNVHHPLFRSKKIRHAFSQAIHREDLIQKHLYGDERPAHSVLESSLSLLPSDEQLLFNIDNARKLFQEGLKEQGLSGSLLKPLKMAIYNQEPFTSVATYVAHAWEEAFGISIIIERLAWNDFIDTLSSTSHDILGMVWYSWYRDPCYTLRIFSNSKNHFNAARWSSEAMRELLDRAEKEQGMHLRNGYLREAERLFMEEMPAVPLYECTCRYMKSEDVDNLYVSHLGNVELKWATFKKKRPFFCAC